MHSPELLDCIGDIRRFWALSSFVLLFCTNYDTNYFSFNLRSLQLTEYEKCLFEWIKLCSQIGNELNSFADNLDEHRHNVAKANIIRYAAKIVGGILGIIGFGLSLVNFKNSLGLAIAGNVDINVCRCKIYHTNSK